MEINFHFPHIPLLFSDQEGRSGKMSGASGAGTGGPGGPGGPGGVGGGGATHIFRSLSSESQKREWSKRLSLRGMRHGGPGGTGSGTGTGSGSSSLASSKEVSQLTKLEIIAQQLTGEKGRDTSMHFEKLYIPINILFA